MEMTDSTFNSVPISSVGVTIEADANRLQRVAEQAHKAWFATPDSIDAKHTFAYALLAWAKETRNQTAIAHAQSLLKTIVATALPSASIAPIWKIAPAL